MSLTDEYTKLKQMVDEAADDVTKADGGNKAAGTRLRKKMQEVKNHVTDLRKQVLESRSDEASAPSS